MTTPRGWSIAQLTAAVAFAALVLAALRERPNWSAIASLVAVGHGLWALVLWRTGAAPRGPSDPRHCLVTAATLAALGIAEGLAAWHCPGSEGLAGWFLVGASLAAAGAVSASRAEPGDMTFVAQLAFHVFVLFPFAIALAQGVLLAHRGSQAPGQSALLEAGMVSVSTLVPILLAMLACALGMSLAKSARRAAWDALLAHELAALLILARWAVSLP